MPTRIDPFLRALNKTVRGPNGCWLFKGAHDRNGHGNVRVHTGEKWTVDKAHRVSYRFWNGEIPERTVVMHKCDVRNCINPDHLVLGTQIENIKDMVSKGRAWWQQADVYDDCPF